MSIAATNYSVPVMVNGFLCKNCTDVDLAKAHIDPQHPSAGPFDANAKADPTLAGKKFDGKSAAVTFGGSLSDASSDTASSGATRLPPLGSQLDLSI
jgi:hypothetical protein